MSNIRERETLITEIKTFEQFRQNGASLKNSTLQALDFSGKQVNWEKFEIDNTTFLGCVLSLDEEILLRRKGAYIYQAPSTLPYNPFRCSLYSWQELMKGFSEKEDNSVDIRIYRHFSATKFNPNINEALWQRIHDHSIDDALRNLLAFTVFGLMWIGITMLLIVAISLLTGILGNPQVAGVVLLPGTLMIAAMIFTSTYFSFRDCFLTEDDGATPPASGAP